MPGEVLGTANVIATSLLSSNFGHRMACKISDEVKRATLWAERGKQMVLTSSLFAV